MPSLMRKQHAPKAGSSTSSVLESVQLHPCLDTLVNVSSYRVDPGDVGHAIFSAGELDAQGLVDEDLVHTDT